MHQRIAIALLVAAFGSSAAFGHSEGHTKKPQRKPVASASEETAFGRAGDPRKVTRTITVGMDDKMHFSSGHVQVRQGDTVKFIVSNKGKVMHEMVIGTMKELREHAELMKKHPGMEHDEPYMAHVSPGKTEIIVWQFTRPGEFHYACLIAGHLEAGMIDRISVARLK